MKKRSFGVTLSIITIVIAVTAVFLIVEVLNTRYEEALNSTNCRTNEQIVNNVKESIDSYLGEMNSLSLQVVEVLENEDGLESFANYEFIMRKDINTLMILDKSGKILMKSNSKPIKAGIDATEEEWFSSVVPGSSIPRYTQPQVQRLYEGEYPWIISLSKGVSWMQDGQKQFGVILVDMNFESIKNLCATEVGEDGEIYIIDENGDIIYHPKQQMLYAGIEDDTIGVATGIKNGTIIEEIKGQKYVISVKPLRSNKWRVVASSQLNGIAKYDKNMETFIGIIIGCMTLGIILVSNIASYYITRPINKLMKLMVQAEDGNFEIRAIEKGFYEIQELSRAFNVMIYKIDQLMRNSIEEEKQLRKSEMKTLHAQINSHFLYNTLDSVIWLAESGDTKNVVKMLAALAQFFRLSLSRGKDMITVEEEICHVENYLLIQKIRFDDQFSYRIDVDERVKNTKVVKMILQPLVENAIIHGVSKLPYEGLIEIAVYAEGDCLILKVSDNGFGMTDAQVESLLYTESKSKSGIGIKNVNNRIQLMSGENYGLSYTSELDEGTQVMVILPLTEEVIF